MFTLTLKPSADVTGGSLIVSQMDYCRQKRPARKSLSVENIPPAFTHFSQRVYTEKENHLTVTL